MIEITDKTKCCGCKACSASCVKNAISFVQDEYGNIFPKVDEEKCVNCNLCERVCPIANATVFYERRDTYAVILNEKEVLNSASGGAFYGLAYFFLNNHKGVVYGCAYDDNMIPTIIGVEDVEQLSRLQGSKYVMSVINDEVYCKIKQNLRKGRKVLFSGVPCQCEAVRKFVGDCTNLYTVELLCHGFVNYDYWHDYIGYLENKHSAKIVDFAFRNKDKKLFVARYKTRNVAYNGKIKEKIYYANPSTSSYYYYFLSGKVYRENCYKCKFAQANRASDITIGDFWGYEGRLDTSKGVSVLICNSEKGKELFSEANRLFDYEERDFAMAARGNGQLNAPISLSLKDYSVLSEWKEKGIKYQCKQHRKQHYAAYLASKIGVFR